jgi:hypothetical protein
MTRRISVYTTFYAAAVCAALVLLVAGICSQSVAAPKPAAGSAPAVTLYVATN